MSFIRDDNGALFHLAVAAAMVPDDVLQLCKSQKRDLYVEVASRILQVDYHDVTKDERYAVKEGLFLRFYQATSDDILRSLNEKQP